MTKQATCKVCKCKYIKTRPLQSVCGFACAQLIVIQNKAKIVRIETKRRKEALLTRSDWVKKAQVAFNAYIRARDINQPCISCGKPLKLEAVGGGYDCGHYRSVGSAPHLRFNEHNAHGQCKKCNNWLSGNVVNYRLGLIERIGLSNVNILESDQCLTKYTMDGLQELTKQYRELARREKAKHE